jgi:outer membrane biosynthesis protein TonB
MRIVLVAWALASVVATTAAAEPTKGLSLEQIRGVMRANVAAFSACLTAATRNHKQLHGPFLYQIEVDKKGKVISARPYQPSAVPSFDKCITGVIKRARFPGGPASVEAPIAFDPS